jgi:hypothetical protein
MKNTFLLFFTAIFSIAPYSAHSTTLNFSSGQYNQANDKYIESGFIVEASHGFNSINLNNLAWYEGDNIIRITSQSGLFDIHQLNIVSPAYAGLVLESSKGGYQSFGSISGLINFSGDEWQSVSLIEIRTITKTDILTQLDNIVLSTIPEPNSGALSLLGFLALFLTLKMKKSQNLLHVKQKTA